MGIRPAGMAGAAGSSRLRRMRPNGKRAAARQGRLAGPAGRGVLVAALGLALAGCGLGWRHQQAGQTAAHTVPDPLAQRLLRLDPPSTALNATRVIWRFFAAHPQ